MPHPLSQAAGLAVLGVDATIAERSRSVTNTRLHGLVGYALRRTGLAALTVWGATVVAFVIVRLVPGDPVLALLGPNSSPEQQATLTRSLGLDQPLPTQYVTWLAHTVTGDLGQSITMSRPVTELLAEAVPYTVSLACLAVLLATIGGIALGMVAVSSPLVRKPFDILTSILVSLPQFSVALVLLAVFAVTLGIFPSGGFPSTGPWPISGDWFAHTFLAALTLALASMGILARTLKSSLTNLRGGDLQVAMEARGLSPWAIRFHLFHNALPSFLVVLGMNIGFMLGGAVFVEMIFNWPGLGLLLYKAATQRDYPVVQAGVLIAAVVFVTVGLLVDLINMLIDPRTQTRGAA